MDFLSYSVLSFSPAVQPNTPEHVTAVVVHDEQGPFVRVSWEKPRTADTRSGWITLLYQLRVKQQKDKEWEVGLKKLIFVSLENV